MTLSETQIQIINSDSINILVLACAGSSKTGCLVKRIQRLIKDGVPPDEIVAVTLTVSAAEEMRLRIGQKIGFVGTLHSFMLGLIQTHWKDLGYAREKISVIDEDSARELELRIMKEVGAGRKRHDFIFEKRYRDELLRYSMLTYDMILTEGLRLIEMGVLAPINHLLIDEIQDFTDLDYAICVQIPCANRFFCGDTDQALFSFRGGNINHILEMAGK